MADLRAHDPSMREKLRNLIAGDTKPHSIRSYLADALTGGDLPLVDMSPLGPVFAADEMKRSMNNGDALGTAASAMGVIPGGKAAGNLIEHAVAAAPGWKTKDILQFAKDDIEQVLGKLPEGVTLRYGKETGKTLPTGEKVHSVLIDGPPEVAARLQHEFGQINKSELKAANAQNYDASRRPKVTPAMEEMALAAKSYEASGGSPNNVYRDAVRERPSVREQLDRQMNPELFSKEEEADHLARGTSAERADELMDLAGESPSRLDQNMRDLEKQDRDYADMHRMRMQPGKYSFNFEDSLGLKGSRKEIQDKLDQIFDVANTEDGIEETGILQKLADKYGIEELHDTEALTNAILKARAPKTRPTQ